MSYDRWGCMVTPEGQPVRRPSRQRCGPLLITRRSRAACARALEDRNPL